MLSMEMIQDARNVLSGVARVTPLYNAPAIGKNIYIKAENLQMTGAFKLRGAYYKISCLTDEEKAKGVIACSAGNHAQGIAYSATKNGVRSIICMPAIAPLSKIEATKNYGAEVVLVDGVYDDAYNKAVELTKSMAIPSPIPLTMSGLSRAGDYSPGDTGAATRGRTGRGTHRGRRSDFWRGLRHKAP